jgi:hypothetical protein
MQKKHTAVISSLFLMGLMSAARFSLCMRTSSEEKKREAKETLPPGVDGVLLGP